MAKRMGLVLAIVGGLFSAGQLYSMEGPDLKMGVGPNLHNVQTQTRDLYDRGVSEEPEIKIVVEQHGDDDRSKVRPRHDIFGDVALAALAVLLFSVIIDLPTAHEWKLISCGL